MAPVTTRSGLRLSPSLSVVAAIPFLNLAPDPGTALAAGLSAVLLGAALGWAVRCGLGDRPTMVTVDTLRRVLAGGAMLAVFAALEMPPAWAAGVVDRIGSGWWDIARIVVSAPAAFVLEVVIGAAMRIGPRTAGRRYVSLLELRDADVYIVLVATGALFGMTWEIVRWLAVGLAGIPYVFANGAFKRRGVVERTHAQMIRALGRIPEAAGHVVDGHADRTAALATSVARRMGLRPSKADLVERAALLHNVGRITLNDPGVARLGFTDADIASWGAEIVEEARLPEVANVVRRQHEVYRRPGEQRDPDLPVAARIIKVCAAFDEAVADRGMSALEALEVLHQGSVYDYDPEIVDELRRVLEATGALVPAPRP
jgi:hypothetical protein